MAITESTKTVDIIAGEVRKINEAEQQEAAAFRGLVSGEVQPNRGSLLDFANLRIQRANLMIEQRADGNSPTIEFWRAYTRRPLTYHEDAHIDVGGNNASIVRNLENRAANPDISYSVIAHTEFGMHADNLLQEASALALVMNQNGEQEGQTLDEVAYRMENVALAMRPFIIERGLVSIAIGVELENLGIESEDKIYRTVDDLIDMASDQPTRNRISALFDRLDGCDEVITVINKIATEKDGPAPQVPEATWYDGGNETGSTQDLSKQYDRSIKA
ncbi:hypothetical protein KC660_03650 [Candidatus Dojkabacteria bacterium]|uniref:Uncharacterized protein n=1 Tax=Candidatus Dojkabacteria bacterium TaxID=2099670 RepID=A0A955L3V3_9BACT|nr:hypothetical protein [Candidatus Dojkabacteria bacterium]